jgi:hypothetical protein
MRFHTDMEEGLDYQFKVNHPHLAMVTEFYKRKLVEIEDYDVSKIFHEIVENKGDIMVFCTEETLYVREDEVDMDKTKEEIVKQKKIIFEEDEFGIMQRRKVFKSIDDITEHDFKRKIVRKIYKSNGMSKIYAGVVISAPMEYWNTLFNHEIAHVFGLKHHCNNPCIMQNIPYNKFDEIVTSFCEDCSEYLNEKLDKITL